VSIPPIEELEAALATALANKRALRATTPVYTYWVRATVRGPFGSFTAKVAFGEGRQPACEFVPESVQGWNFSSQETAEQWAAYAALRVYPGLSGDCAVFTDVVEES